MKASKLFRLTLVVGLSLLLGLGLLIGGGALSWWMLRSYVEDVEEVIVSDEAEEAAAPPDESPLPSGARVRLGSLCFRHGAKPRWLAFTSDGRTLVSHAEGEVIFWDAATGRALRVWSRGETDQLSPFNFIDLSPDDQLLASGGQDRTVRLWDVGSGKEIRRLQEREAEDRVQYGDDGVVVFSPDGTRLASYFAPAKIRVWDVATGKRELEFNFTNKDRSVRSLAFSPDGRTLAIAESGSEIVQLWDAASGKPVGQFTGHQGILVSPLVEVVTFSRVGQAASAALADPVIRLWDPVTGTELRQFRAGPLFHSYSTHCLAFSADGTMLAGESAKGSVTLWATATARVMRTIRHAHTAEVQCLAFSPDGNRLASGGRDGRIAVWDTRTGKNVVPSRGHRNAVEGLVFTPDGKNLVTSAGDGTVRIWDVHSGQELRRLNGLDEDDLFRFSASPLAISPDGQLLAAGAMENRLRLWDVASARKVRDCPHDQPSSGKFVAFAFSADGNSLVTVTEGSHVCIRDVASGSVLRRFTLDGYDAVLSPHGNLLGLRVDRQVQVWDVVSGKELCRLGDDLRNRVAAVAFSADGSMLATASYPDVDLWNARNGRRIRRFPADVACLAFSVDGKWLAGGGTDKWVHVWEAESGKELTRLPGHRGEITTLAFSSDGRLLASASTDTTVLVWDLHHPAGKGGQ